MSKQNRDEVVENFLKMVDSPEPVKQAIRDIARQHILPEPDQAYKGTKSDHVAQRSEGEPDPIVNLKYDVANPLPEVIGYNTYKFWCQYFILEPDDLTLPEHLDKNGKLTEDGMFRLWESDKAYDNPTYADAFEAARQFLVETGDFHTYFEGVDVIEGDDGWRIWLRMGS